MPSDDMLVPGRQERLKGRSRCRWRWGGGGGGVRTGGTALAALPVQLELAFGVTERLGPHQRLENRVTWFRLDWRSLHPEHTHPPPVDTAEKGSSAFSKVWR